MMETPGATVAAQCHVGVSSASGPCPQLAAAGVRVGTHARCIHRRVATRCAPALPELAITTATRVATRCAPALPELAITTATRVATRCAPALPELAITTSGNLDFSSCVYIGEGPGQQGR